MQSKKLEELTKDELIVLVKQLKKRKKYGIVWEEKSENVVEQCKKELPVLEEVNDRAIQKESSLPTNLIIEGDNYHALSVLNYTHAGKIDVIYIDPPYNTGAKDWKYNNDFVDSEDPFRHSKWLSFMDKRLRLAHKLLKPNGVLIITIDEHEVHHLGVLLEEVYPEAYRQMVTIVINPKGVTQGRFARVDEHAFFCFFGKASVASIGDDLLTPLSDEDNGNDKPRWKGLLRSGTNARREDRKNLFYPVLIDEKRGCVVGTGEPLPFEQEPDISQKIKGYMTVWPKRTDGSWGNWGVGHITLKTLIDKGYVNLGSYDPNRNTWSISYLSRTAQDQLQAGLLEIVNFDKDKNVVDVRWTGEIPRSVKTVWHRSRHDAGAYGTDHLRKILGSRNFSFPKSIFAVIDCLSVVTKLNPNAIVLDFFAGSGTTGEAVLSINKEYGGNRSFILCTNNENSIAEDVCYPRMRKIINGYAQKDGIPANMRYFKTNFVSSSKVSDDTRQALVKKSTEMICIRENTFNKVADKPAYKIYSDTNHITGILFDLDAINEFKDSLRERKLTAHIYVFSLSNDTYTNDFADLELKHKLCPIPESILEVYRKLFK